MFLSPYVLARVAIQFPRGSMNRPCRNGYVESGHDSQRLLNALQRKFAALLGDGDSRRTSQAKA